MTVNEVIVGAARLIGRAQAADYLSSPESFSVTDAEKEEAESLARGLLLYYNAVIDELARGYFPLFAEQTFTSPDGSYSFSDFDYTPLKIRKIFSEDGLPVKWRLRAGGFTTCAKTVTVAYEYAPDSAALSDEFSYPEYAVGVYLVQCGVAAEYFLVTGDGIAYKAWEGKYRDEIENFLRRNPEKNRVPPRRWI